MIKLVQQIVDQSYKLIGFVAEGKAKDFGELSNEKITKPISMKYLFETGFANKQIMVKNGLITEKEGFKLNNLPMLMLTDSGYQEIDNSITIVKRYVQDNENVGFGVKVGNTDCKFSYENVIKMCDLFRPVNFVIRYGANNKRFIAGKSGMSLTSLPCEVIGTPSAAKRVKPTTKDIEKVTGNFVTEVDIMDLYDFIRNANGFIINLPGTAYKATTESAPAAKEFSPFNIGEVGSPWLDFNESKFNINCNFKKPGIVVLETQPGNKTSITTFVYRKKNIFYNGNNYINKLGVVIPSSANEELMTRFGRTMSFTAIVDPGMIQVISMLIGQQNVKMYEVDTSKIGLIAKSKLDGYILPTEDLYKKVYELTCNKYIVKYLNGLIKDLKESGGFTSGEKVKDIVPQFAHMSNETLHTLAENGIDIYTGAFTIKDEGAKKHSGGEVDEAIEVSYAIEGMNIGSLSYKQMVAGDKKVPVFLEAVIAKFASIDDFNEKGLKAREMVDTLEKKNSQLKREIWMHKCSMYIKSNKSSVHSHDAKKWEVNASKRTKAKCYTSKVKGCEKLQLLVLNIDIK